MGFANYDHWKATNPADEHLGPEPWWCDLCRCDHYDDDCPKDPQREPLYSWCGECASMHWEDQECRATQMEFTLTLAAWILVGACMWVGIIMLGAAIIGG